MRKLWANRHIQVLARGAMGDRVSPEEHKEAIKALGLSELEALVNEYCRKHWSLRRLLDLERPYSVDQRSYWKRLLPRQRREQIAMAILSGGPVAEWRRRQGVTDGSVLRRAEEMAPRIGRPITRKKRRSRGRPRIIDENLVASVDAWRSKLQLVATGASRIHRINPSRGVSIKAAIKDYLREKLDRPPTSREVAVYQARYSQLTR